MGCRRLACRKISRPAGRLDDESADRSRCPAPNGRFPGRCDRLQLRARSGLAGRDRPPPGRHSDRRLRARSRASSRTYASHKLRATEPGFKPGPDDLFLAGTSRTPRHLRMTDRTKERSIETTIYHFCSCRGGGDTGCRRAWPRWNHRRDKAGNLHSGRRRSARRCRKARV
jgi:hypothetical protein